VTVRLDVQISSSAEELPEQSELLKWVEAALRKRRKRAELTIRLVDEEEIRALNRDFRGQDKATNVLSFPVDLPDWVESDLLGDLVICAPVVAQEALMQDKPARAHWAHMVVHGTLHLLGMDHKTDKEAGRMEQAEVKTLSRLGFPDPYQATANHE